VTHQLQYLKDADLIVVLKEGKVQETGTFQHLAKNGLDFSSLLTLEEEEEKEEEEDIFSEEDIILMKGRDPGWNHINISNQFTKDSRKGLFIISKYIRTSIHSGQALHCSYNMLGAKPCVQQYGLSSSIYEFCGFDSLFDFCFFTKSF